MAAKCVAIMRERHMTVKKKCYFEINMFEFINDVSFKNCNYFIIVIRLFL